MPVNTSVSCQSALCFQSNTSQMTEIQKDRIICQSRSSNRNRRNKTDRQPQVNQQEGDMMLNVLSCPCGEHLIDSFCKYNQYKSKTYNSSELHRTHKGDTKLNKWLLHKPSPSSAFKIPTSGGEVRTFTEVTARILQCRNTLLQVLHSKCYSRTEVLATKCIHCAERLISE